MTDDVVAFINARLAEDQAGYESDSNHALRCASAEVCGPPSWSAPDMDRCDCPQARVRRAVEAKRRMLARHRCEPDTWCDDDGQPLDLDLCTTCAYGRSCSCCFDREYDGPFAKWPCPEVRDLASEWSTHPDWRPEWAPDEDRQSAGSVEGGLDSVAPIPPTGQDRPLGDGLLPSHSLQVARAACPCLGWAIADIRTAVFPNGHHEVCDGTGHRKDQP